MRAVVLLGIAVAACSPTRSLFEEVPEQSREEWKDIPVSTPRALDLLFVVDDSPSMAAWQPGLAETFRVFALVLQTIEGGVPDLHLGVVSTDLGAPAGVPGCHPGGDGGRLHGAASADGAFLVDTPTVRGRGECGPDGSRHCNYTGTFADAVAGLAAVGVDGCGFEQPLEAMRRALDGSNPGNAGFRRADAALVVVFVGDEDDCSVADPALFATDPDAVATLGPLSSFRCTEYGVACEGDADPRAPGPRTGCAPREPSPYLPDVGEYVDFLLGLAPDASQVAVSAMAGPPTPFVVGVDPVEPSIPALEPSCTGAEGGAAPAVRLKAFLDRFPDRNGFDALCNGGADALWVVSSLCGWCGEHAGNPCLQSELAEPVECAVSDVVHPGQGDQVETPLPACDAVEPTPLDPTDLAASTNVPCWHLERDEANCGETPTALSLIVERDAISPPPGTHVIARCRGAT